MSASAKVIAEVLAISSEKVPPVGDSIRVGSFELRALCDGSFYIRAADGEGMQVSAEKLTACLDEFYGREF